MTSWMRFGAAALATWRVTHLLANEDGPADVIARARECLGASQLGAMMDCFQCVSIWVAAPFALYVARKPADRVVAWLALSGAACVLDELATNKSQSQGAFDELLRAQTSSEQGLAVASPRSSALSSCRAD